MIEIPVSFKDQSADFEQIIDLEAVTVTIRLTYNTRNNYWYASFSTDNNSITSVKLVTEFLLLDQYKAVLNEIKGDFIVTRVADDLNVPDLSYENFGIDWAFQYLTESEAESFKEEKGI